MVHAFSNGIEMIGSPVTFTAGACDLARGSEWDGYTQGLIYDIIPDADSPYASLTVGVDTDLKCWGTLAYVFYGNGTSQGWSLTGKMDVDRNSITWDNQNNGQYSLTFSGPWIINGNTISGNVTYHWFGPPSETRQVTCSFTLRTCY